MTLESLNHAVELSFMCEGQKRHFQIYTGLEIIVFMCYS